MTSPPQMDGRQDGGPSTPEPADGPGGSKRFTIRQAAFIGVGAMVGAGIFSLLGAAGEVAGAAVWLSFLIAGAVAILNGYSFAKFGARYPSAGGLLEYIARGFGDRRGEGMASWNLGLVLEKEGEFAQAADLMQVLVDYELEIGHPDAEKHAAEVADLRARIADPARD